MEQTFGIFLVGLLGACLGLYLIWKVCEEIDYFRIRRHRQRRRDAGQSRFCRWYVDEAGNLGRVITTRPGND